MTGRWHHPRFNEAELQSRFPHINNTRVIGRFEPSQYTKDAIYSEFKALVAANEFKLIDAITVRSPDENIDTRSDPSVTKCQPL